jgi:hypothetical protein
MQPNQALKSYGFAAAWLGHSADRKAADGV